MAGRGFLGTYAAHEVRRAYPLSVFRYWVLLGIRQIRATKKLTENFIVLTASKLCAFRKILDT